MNTVARMVSGALGVAVIGSLVSSLYERDVDVAGLPPRAQEAAGESIGAASAIAAQLPPVPGAHLLESAATAFTDAMGLGLALGAALTLGTAVVVVRALSDVHVAGEVALERGTDRGDQDLGIAVRERLHADDVARHHEPDHLGAREGRP
jgi:hypothetical protein